MAEPLDRDPGISGTLRDSRGLARKRSVSFALAVGATATCATTEEGASFLGDPASVRYAVKVSRIRLICLRLNQTILLSLVPGMDSVGKLHGVEARLDGLSASVSADALGRSQFQRIIPEITEGITIVKYGGTISRN